jgi:hypothetical protein
VIDVEAWPDSADTQKRTHEQSGSGERDEAKRDLGRDQRLPRAVSGAARGAAARASVEQECTAAKSP